MPYEVRSDPDRNLLYVRLEGYFGDDEAVQVADRVIAEVGRLRAGFEAITDIRHYKPGSPKMVEQMMRTQLVYKSKAIRRVIRIVGENVVAKMQLQRTGKEVGLEMAYVTSLAEAEILLRA
jgi:hypothetical protein